MFRVGGSERGFIDFRADQRRPPGPQRNDAFGRESESPGRPEVPSSLSEAMKRAEEMAARIETRYERRSRSRPASGCRRAAYRSRRASSSSSGRCRSRPRSSLSSTSLSSSLAAATCGGGRHRARSRSGIRADRHRLPRRGSHIGRSRSRGRSATRRRRQSRGHLRHSRSNSGRSRTRSPRRRRTMSRYRDSGVPRRSRSRSFALSALAGSDSGRHEARSRSRGARSPRFGAPADDDPKKCNHRRYGHQQIQPQRSGGSRSPGPYRRNGRPSRFDAPRDDPTYDDVLSGCRQRSLSRARARSGTRSPRRAVVAANATRPHRNSSSSSSSSGSSQGRALSVGGLNGYTSRPASSPYRRMSAAHSARGGLVSEESADAHSTTLPLFSSGRFEGALSRFEAPPSPLADDGASFSPPLPAHHQRHVRQQQQQLQLKQQMEQLHQEQLERSGACHKEELATVCEKAGAGASASVAATSASPAAVSAVGRGGARGADDVRLNANGSSTSADDENRRQTFGRDNDAHGSLLSSARGGSDDLYEGVSNDSFCPEVSKKFLTAMFRSLEPALSTNSQKEMPSTRAPKHAVHDTVRRQRTASPLDTIFPDVVPYKSQQQRDREHSVYSRAEYRSDQVSSSRIHVPEANFDSSRERAEYSEHRELYVPEESVFTNPKLSRDERLLAFQTLRSRLEKAERELESSASESKLSFSKERSLARLYRAGLECQDERLRPLIDQMFLESSACEPLKGYWNPSVERSSGSHTKASLYRPARRDDCFDRVIPADAEQSILTDSTAVGAYLTRRSSPPETSRSSNSHVGSENRDEVFLRTFKEPSGRSEVLDDVSHRHYDQSETTVPPTCDHSVSSVLQDINLQTSSSAVNVHDARSTECESWAAEIEQLKRRLREKDDQIRAYSRVCQGDSSFCSMDQYSERRGIDTADEDSRHRRSSCLRNRSRLSSPSRGIRRSPVRRRTPSRSISPKQFFYSRSPLYQRRETRSSPYTRRTPSPVERFSAATPSVSTEVARGDDFHDCVRQSAPCNLDRADFDTAIGERRNLVYTRKTEASQLGQLESLHMPSNHVDISFGGATPPLHTALTDASGALPCVASASKPVRPIERGADASVETVQYKRSNFDSQQSYYSYHEGPSQCLHRSSGDLRQPALVFAASALTNGTPESQHQRRGFKGQVHSDKPVGEPRLDVNAATTAHQLIGSGTDRPNLKTLTGEKKTGSSKISVTTKSRAPYANASAPAVCEGEPGSNSQPIDMDIDDEDEVGESEKGFTKVGAPRRDVQHSSSSQAAPADCGRPEDKYSHEILSYLMQTEDKDNQKERLTVLKQEMARISKLQADLLRLRAAYPKDQMFARQLFNTGKLYEEARKKATSITKTIDSLSQEIFKIPQKIKLLAMEHQAKFRPQVEALKVTKRDKEQSLQQRAGSIREDRKEVHVKYVDRGEFFCSFCRIEFKSVAALLKHLHTDNHITNSNQSQDRPWAAPDTSSKMIGPPRSTCNVPAKGGQFMMGIRGFYCKICKDLFPDNITAEKHILSEEHNLLYKEYIGLNPFYELRVKLEKETLMHSISMATTPKTTKTVESSSSGDSSNRARLSTTEVAKEDRSVSLTSKAESSGAPSVKRACIDKGSENGKLEKPSEEKKPLDRAPDDDNDVTVSDQSTAVIGNSASQASGEQKPLVSKNEMQKQEAVRPISSRVSSGSSTNSQKGGTIRLKLLKPVVGSQPLMVGKAPFKRKLSTNIKELTPSDHGLSKNWNDDASDVVDCSAVAGGAEAAAVPCNDNGLTHAKPFVGEPDTAEPPPPGETEAPASVLVPAPPSNSDAGDFWNPEVIVAPFNPAVPGESFGGCSFDTVAPFVPDNHAEEEELEEY